MATPALDDHFLARRKRSMMPSGSSIAICRR